jgi:ABC-type sugar transport system ATPase subunit
VRAELSALQHSRDAVMICATHHQIKAIPMAHQITALNRGRIEQILSQLRQDCPPASGFGGTFFDLNFAPSGAHVSDNAGRVMRRLAAPAVAA